MNVTDALATSPNTAFAKLIQQVGVPRAVDMAVRLGMRSYATAGHRARLRPAEQRKPGRLHQATEHRLVHAGPVRAQRARVVQCGGDAGLRRRCGARRTRSTRSSTATATRCRSPPRRATRWCPRDWPTRCANALSKDDQGGGTAAGVGRLGGLEPADVRQDRHHRVASLVGLPGLHQPLRRGELHLRRLHARRPASVLVPAAAVRSAATCSAATSPPAPGSPR